jgi:ribosome maturation factor RimP
MITRQQIQSLVEEHYSGTDHFLVEVIIRNGNIINVFIDGDHGVTIDVCRELSRYIEEKLDRDTLDFELTVSSAGADRPLVFPRQYLKNIGKGLELVTVSGETMTGILVRADESGVELEKTVKKGKKTTEKNIVSLKFDEIKTAKEVISFK